MTFFCLNLAAQLELSKIMSGNEFIGHQPQDIVWSPGSDFIYFRWRHENENIAPYYEYSLAGKKYRKLSADETLTIPVDGFSSHKSNSLVLFKKGSRLYKKMPKSTQLIFSKFGSYSVHEILNENQIILREGNNLFLLDLASPSLIQITNFQTGNKPSASTNENFLTEQQDELFEIVRAEKQRSNDRKKFSEAHSSDELSPVYLEGKSLSFITINPQLTHIIFGLDKYPDDKGTHIEEYVSSDGYSRSVNARPKVGSEDPKHELYFWDLKKDTCFQLKLDGLTGVKNRPEFFKEYEAENFQPTSDAPKNVIFHSHGFNDAGSKSLIEIKSYDNKDRWIVYIDTALQSLSEIEHQHTESWIGGPGISGWKGEAGNVGWINDNTAYFQSEESGYSHLYSCNFRDKSLVKKEALTDGNFEIHAATLSKDKTKFFVIANKNHPGNREFYTLDITSKKLTPVLTSDGNHEVSISPDEKWLAVKYSSKNKPWELYTAPLKENTVLTQITKSTTSEFDNYEWRAPEVITFNSQDGKTIYARLYEPDPEVKNGAGILFVHGAGYLQNAHNWWSTYYREYMFHNLLADKGYTILDIDYRASEGYGSDFRTAIYRHMGGKDLSDHLDGRKVLVEKYGIDSTRIGIYGGSYGGFITLMAMLTEPGKFKCGAALRSVTDWAHYNHDYTSNILNTPEQDPLAFKQSSPIYFASGLEGRLLMLHGIEDDNVQYQDVVRLSQRFIELRKTNWDLIGYPIEPHGFVETSSWIDEYRRILEMFDEELAK